MHQTIVVALFSLSAGLVLGTLYGRKVEQKVVGTALAEYANAGRISQAVLDSLRARLAYLKKYV